MTIYYIAPATHPTTPGNDTTGDGSSGTPWATISKAHTSATSGDTVICKDGTYTWANQTFTKILTIQADNTLLAIFDAGGGQVAWITRANLSCTGLRFTNNIKTAINQTIFLPGDTVSEIVSFTNCKFDNMQVDGVTNGGQGGVIGPGLTATPGSPTVNLTGCIFDDIVVRSGASDNYLFGARLDAVNRTFTYNLTNCIIYLAGTSPAPIGDIFFKYSGASAGAQLNLSITNTIVSNQTGGTVNFIGGGGTPNITDNNNNVWHNITSAPSGADNLTSDPQMIDPANGNFNLQITSPARAAGATP